MTHRTPDLSRFLNWKSHVQTQGEKYCRVEYWLFTHVAVVLLAGKAGELLNLDLRELDLKPDEAESIIDRRCHEWQLDVHVLVRSQDAIKFVVYRTKRVEEQLSRVPPCILHGRLRYPENVDARSFLATIAHRWNAGGTIPHEIGFALGYPIDDVLGYMGIESMQCKGFCGWQVFGDWDEAQRRRCAYRRARERALQFIAA
ncbi:MAG: DUF3793 family protein [Alkalispirochaeta sp.]